MSELLRLIPLPEVVAAIKVPGFSASWIYILLILVILRAQNLFFYRGNEWKSVSMPIIVFVLLLIQYILHWEDESITLGAVHLDFATSLPSNAFIMGCALVIVSALSPKRDDGSDYAFAVSVVFLSLTCYALGIYVLPLAFIWLLVVYILRVWRNSLGLF